jgi:hypothetical protein
MDSRLFGFLLPTSASAKHILLHGFSVRISFLLSGQKGLINRQQSMTGTAASCESGCRGAYTSRVRLRTGC